MLLERLVRGIGQQEIDRLRGLRAQPLHGVGERKTEDVCVQGTSTATLRGRFILCQRDLTHYANDAGYP